MKTLLFFGILSVGSILMLAMLPQSTIHDFAQKYDGARTERERLMVCIDAVDKKIIFRTGQVRVIDQVFGTRYSESLPAKGNPFARGFVHFSDQPAPHPSNAYARPYVGWYFTFEFDHTGSIQSYYFSNLHK
jgi:hypothetical protein